ncbi:putative metallopeptidase [Stygiolobus sp. RP850M]|uniref:putative metallopeptidase n=1 Tax=Stygiolobus sp. RP850M TaxID=3133137 RepID=UPI00307E2D3A
MGKRIQYEFAKDVELLATRVNEVGKLGLDLSKVVLIRSWNSKSNAIARVLMLPSQWRFVLNSNILYVVEVIAERYEMLSCQQKVGVILHELTHLPKNMSGGLRGHNYKEFKVIKRKSEKISKEICK